MPTLVSDWTASDLAQELEKGLPQCTPKLVREKIKQRIIDNNVTGLEVVRLLERMSTPGRQDIRSEETFKRIFEDDFNDEDFGIVTNVRGAVHVCYTFFASLLNENASVVVQDAKTKIFEIIDVNQRAYEFDSYYPAEETWCIASGEQAKVQAAHEGGQHVEGFYMSPCGWTRLGLKVSDDGSKNFTGDEFLTWHKAYHGTRGSSVASIVQNGLLQPGATAPNFGKIENQHGSAGAVGGKVPIYATPSLEYASHFIYTESIKDACNKSVLGIDGVKMEKSKCSITRPEASSVGLGWDNMVGQEETFAQFVFEVRVKPSSFRVQGNTIGDWPKVGEYSGPYPKTKFLPYDDLVLSDNLEWLIDDSRNIVCTGVMIRQLPHSLRVQEQLRIDYMRELTDFDGENGCKRPRDYCNGARTLTQAEVSKGVRWEFNSGDSTLSYTDDQKWQAYDPTTSELIERAYQHYQRFVFLGKSTDAPGPYMIYFATEWKKEADHYHGCRGAPCEGPEQRRADPDKEQGWRRRAVRRVPC